METPASSSTSTIVPGPPSAYRPAAGAPIDKRRMAATPIDSRTLAPSRLRTLFFILLFDLSILTLNLLQFIIAPLYIHPFTRVYYEKGIAYTKLGFGRLIVAISQLFGPSRIVLSLEDDEGNLLDPHPLVKRDRDSRIIGVNLPPRAVWMANHQVYTDWLYLWNLAYYADLADSILIILKASLKWIPFVGWGMQFFRFIFLRRSWASDRGPLAHHLAFMASRCGKAKEGAKASELSAKDKLLLLIFPEGTLVSKLTRPVSKKYADKMGWEDRRNLLLPRSTGLLFCLRALAAEIDDLQLVDFCIGYPGIPTMGYGQSYYTLRSIFMQGIPPPAVHLHMRLSKASSLPLGKLPTSAASSATSTGDSTEAEKAAFDAWLQERWAMKDKRMDAFYRDGDFVKGAFKELDDGAHVDAISRGASHGGLNDPLPALEGEHFVTIPIEMRSGKEFGDLFAWGAPLLVAWAAWMLYRTFA